MIGFTVSAGPSNAGFPIRGLFVESAQRISTFGDRRPGFVGSRDVGHEAACGEGDMTALRSLSLFHAETARLFCRGV
jgi:hypothetical protein